MLFPCEHPSRTINARAPSADQLRGLFCLSELNGCASAIAALRQSVVSA
jgi:hypothetical protein